MEALREAIRMGDIDTVVVAMTDMQGRLQGKRFHARYFLDEVVPHATEACAYLLAVDTEMNTVDGYELASWESGYGDFVLVPDLATLRVIGFAGIWWLASAHKWFTGPRVQGSTEEMAAIEAELESLA